MSATKKINGMIFDFFDSDVLNEVSNLTDDQIQNLEKKTILHPIYDEKMSGFVYSFRNQIYFIKHSFNDEPCRTTGRSQYWYSKNKPHRVQGPAFISPYCTQWFINGLLHREDGPADIYRRSSKDEERWYLFGQKLNDEDSAMLKDCLNKEDRNKIVSLLALKYNNIR